MNQTENRTLSVHSKNNFFRKGQMFAGKQKMTIIALAAVLLILAGSSIRTLASEGNTPVQKYYTSIRVKKGDTLWKIADSYAGGMSKKEYIREVCRLNHINADDILRSGDYIVVMYYPDNEPAPSEANRIKMAKKTH